MGTFSKNFHGKHLDLNFEILDGYPLDFHWISIGFPLDFHQESIGNPMDMLIKQTTQYLPIFGSFL